jgi:hypothetical protein
VTELGLSYGLNVRGTSSLLQCGNVLSIEPSIHQLLKVQQQISSMKSASLPILLKGHAPILGIEIMPTEEAQTEMDTRGDEVDICPG